MRDKLNWVEHRGSVFTDWYGHLKDYEEEEKPIFVIGATNDKDSCNITLYPDFGDWYHFEHKEIPLKECKKRAELFFAEYMKHSAKIRKSKPNWPPHIVHAEALSKAGQS